MWQALLYYSRISIAMIQLFLKFISSNKVERSVRSWNKVIGGILFCMRLSLTIYSVEKCLEYVFQKEKLLGMEIQSQGM